MVQALFVRAMRGIRRLPATRPKKVDIPWMGSRRGAHHGVLPLTGGVNSVGGSAVFGARDDRVGTLGSLIRKPIDVDPLPLGDQVPVTISVPRHQASNSEGFVFTVEASCDCLCDLYTPAAAAHARDAIIATAQAAARVEMAQGDWKYESISLEQFAQRVKERMASSSPRSSSGDSSIAFTKYTVTSMQLHPAATLAYAATQAQDPPVPLVWACCVELGR